MRVFALLLAVALASVDVREAVTRISKLVPVTSGPATLLQLAGRYVDASQEVARLAGPALSGTQLHLFPDGTYIHAEWADIEPLTIDDKGTWSVKEGIIRLESDRSITWKTTVEREFAPIRRKGSPAVILIISPQQLAYFEGHARESSSDAEFMLLITTMQREETYGPTKAGEVRHKLLTTAWRPLFFR